MTRWPDGVVSAHASVGYEEVLAHAITVAPSPAGVTSAVRSSQHVGRASRQVDGAPAPKVRPPAPARARATS